MAPQDRRSKPPRPVYTKLRGLSHKEYNQKDGLISPRKIYRRQTTTTLKVSGQGRRLTSNQLRSQSASFIDRILSGIEQGKQLKLEQLTPVVDENPDDGETLLEVDETLGNTFAVGGGDTKDLPRDKTGRQQKPRFNINNRKRIASNWETARSVLATSLLTGGRGCCGASLLPESLLSGSPFIRKAKVLLVSFTTATWEDVSVCSCVHGISSSLISLGYFPSSPIRPTVAISLEVLQLFHNVLMEGPISKRAFAMALQMQLERKTKSHLPSLVKPFYNSYAQWQAAQDAANDTVMRTIFELTGCDLSPSQYCNICPACFYRSGGDCDELLILSVDGVFSHRRLKLASNRAEGFEDIPTYLFHTPDKSLEERVQNYTEPLLNCDSNLRAANKPKTMKQFDETGMMGIACRHGHGVRYQDMYEGERYKYALGLFQAVVRGNPTLKTFALIYDIGCRFDPFLRHVDPELSKTTTVAVNAMHVYGHPLSCQILRGPRRQVGFGETDGEGNERDWSSKIHLVASGRCSSAARKRQALDAQSRYRNRQLVEKLPEYLWKRFKRARQRAQESERELERIFETTLRIGHSPGILIEWSASFVDKQIDAQREFFRKNRDRKKDYMTNKKIANALKKEQLLTARLENAYMKSGGSKEKAISEKVWVETAVFRKLPEYVEDTDSLLNAARQTRQDWEVGSQLWEKYLCPSDTFTKVHQAIQREKKQRMLVDDTLRKNPTLSPQTDPWVKLEESTYAKLRQESDKLLQKHGLERQDHDEGSPIWAKFRVDEIAESLEVILNELLVLVAQRSHELKELHSRVSGQKEAKPLITSLYRRYPAITSLVQKFNVEAKKIPPPYSIALLSPEAFHPPADDVTGNAQESLWNYELLQVQLSLNRVQSTFDMDPESSDMIWGQSREVREAINFRLRKLRGDEECILVRNEMDRLWKWIQGRYRSLIAVSDSINIASGINIVKELMWDELHILASFKKVHSDLFDATKQVLIQDMLQTLVDRSIDRKTPIVALAAEAFDAKEDENEWEDEFFGNEDAMAALEVLLETTEKAVDDIMIVNDMLVESCTEDSVD